MNSSTCNLFQIREDQLLPFICLFDRLDQFIAIHTVNKVEYACIGLYIVL